MENETQNVESAWGTLLRGPGQHELFGWKTCFGWWQKVKKVVVLESANSEWLGRGHQQHLCWKTPIHFSA